ncbi:DUF2637 domain-containing protein [Kitasatospora sp. NPDC004240]
MNLDFLPRTGAPLVQLLTSWQFVAGTLVLSLGPTLALRRRRAVLAAASEQSRTAALVRRGHRIEDQLTMLVAAAAASLSATGLRHVGQNVMGLTDPFDLLPFVALDIATLICGRRARRRARSGDGPGLSGALFWILAGTSALFSATEADSLVGAVVRAVWPVLAAVLWEVGSLEERRAARRGRADRRLALIRLFHPVESVRVALLLAARQELNQDEATIDVRVARAAYRWYRLRRAQEATKKASRPTRWAYRLLEARADARAQNASERAGCADPAVLEQVVARLQQRVRQTEWAGMNLRSGAAFEALRSTLIGIQSAVPAHTGTVHTATQTESATDANSQVEAGMDPADETDAASDQMDRDIADVPPDDAQHKDGAGKWLSDEQVMEAFVRLVPRHPDGRLAWGINKSATAIGIGTPRAKRFHESQTNWLPAAVARYADDSEQQLADQPVQPNHLEQPLAPANPAGLDISELLFAPSAPTGFDPQLPDLLARDYESLPTGLFVPASASRP